MKNLKNIKTELLKYSENFTEISNESVRKFLKNDLNYSFHKCLPKKSIK